MDDALSTGWDGLRRGRAASSRALLRAAGGGDAPASYRRYDWHAGRVRRDRRRAAGAAAGASRASGPARRRSPTLVTVLVWVEAPATVRLARGLARDGGALEPQLGGAGPWPRSEHFAATGPRERADLLVRPHPAGPAPSARPPRVSAMLPPSGEQFEISGGGYRAVVTESGGALRRARARGRTRSSTGSARTRCRPGGRGQLLMPWPNRIRDGAYSFDGRDLQLPLTEPARHNASHGLARWVAWSPEEHTGHSVALTYRLMAQTGYPWTLDLRVVYDLSADGLTVTQSATNLARHARAVRQRRAPLPRGRPRPGRRLGAHPARRRPARSSTTGCCPTGARTVAGTDYDFRIARPVRDGRVQRRLHRPGPRRRRRGDRRR